MAKPSQIEILGKIAQGLTDQEIAKLLDVDAEKVAEIREESAGLGLIRRGSGAATAAKMTHEEREQRRKDIAAFIDAGGSKEDAAAKFDVTVASVNVAIKEYGKVGPRERKESTQAEIFRVAALFLAGWNNNDIAKELDMDRERVRLMKNAAENAGFFKEFDKALLEAARAGLPAGAAG